MTSSIYICILLIAVNCGIIESSFRGWNKDRDPLEALRNIERRNYQEIRKLVCKRWNQRCQPWSEKPDHVCCGGMACKCNLWMQNCKCVSRLWG